jgi:hypothetical protein
LGIPKRLLLPSVRNGRALPKRVLTRGIVESWERDDKPIYLLRLPKSWDIPRAVEKYLNTF